MGFAALRRSTVILPAPSIPVVGSPRWASCCCCRRCWPFLPFGLQPAASAEPEGGPFATFLELRRDPATGANAIEIVRPTSRGAAARSGSGDYEAPRRTLADLSRPYRTRSSW